ncbi:MAG TPA: phenylalanine--tRNA ligase subunit beta [Anaerolineales bacterium]|nr:phenylalanine--tRNA ligase subunit beta [Anaerolineales bacterium]
MKTPISWLKDYVAIQLPIDELARRLTMAGLEVEEIHYVGLPLPNEANPAWSSKYTNRQEAKITGLSWDPEKIVVGAIHEVMPHPNADRLVLCRLEDGEREHVVLTGAPNLFQYKGSGPLVKPIKVAYAREGARIYDGHQPGQVLVTLKRARIRGVESYSMACSEKELGISDEHEGIIILDDDAPLGMSLADYMGDAVLEIAITPNIARNANILGVAREIAALTGQKLRQPDYQVLMEGPPVAGRVAIEIRQPALNPRFVLGLIENITIKPSPYWVQRRLRLAGMRPINNIVDATNYAMMDIGEPLHAFDYDVLVSRAGSKTPTIITRTPEPGERLTTLDDIERQPDDFTVLVCDQAGPLALAGVMGGAESEVSEKTRNVLLEGAAWNMINTRRTVISQNLPSEAAYRFSRGVHPAMAERGVRRGLELMRQWSGGVVANGLVDNYPLPPLDPTVTVTPADVRRWLGIELSPQEIAGLLSRLEFKAEIDGQSVRATTPDHRLDIGEGVIGMADLMEELARIYGYDKIPETRMSDTLPPQRSNPQLDLEERVRDALVKLGLQEVITYRMTTPEREGQRLPPSTPPDDHPYLQIANPIASDRAVMRHSLLSSLLEVVERNARIRPRQALFEIGPVYFASEASQLPDELLRLAFALTGPRNPVAWQAADTSPMDFYDLKGILTQLLESLHIGEARFAPHQHPSFHPGKCARLLLGEHQLGVFGELHPLAHAQYDLPETPLLAADLDMQVLFQHVPERYEIQPVPSYPPVLEDLAFVVDGSATAEMVTDLIRAAGGETVVAVHLFDVYRGAQVGPGKKSLAYSLTYQSPERTLTDQDVALIRQRIIKRLEQELGARLRS